MVLSTMSESNNKDEDDVLTKNGENDSSDEEMFSKSKQIKRTKNVFDSDDEEMSDDPKVEKSNGDSDSSNSSSKSSNKPAKKSKKRIVKQSDSDSDESTAFNTSRNETIIDENDNSSGNENESKYSQSNRIKEKRIKFENKFKSMLSKRDKLSKSNEVKSDDKSSIKTKTSISNLYDLDSSDDDVTKGQNAATEKSEGSEEEEEIPSKSLITKGIQRKDKIVKDKPKVQRMSAKQAMEQMHKIKSESGRMLREKQVLLPYHKPKQMSLKDILAKRNNKSMLTNSKLGFRMDENQLKQFAKELEKKKEEMLELCKSESEEEEERETDKQSEEKEGNKVETESENKVENNVNTEDKSDEFKSLQKACKNLLDMFDENEQSEKPVLEINDSTSNLEEVSDKPNEKDNSIEQQKNANNTWTNNDESSDEAKSNGKSIPETSEENVEQEIIENQVEEASSEDVANGDDGIIDKTSLETVDKNDDLTNNELPESELLFEDDTDIDYDFKIDDIVKKVNEDCYSKQDDDKMIVDDNVVSVNPKGISVTQIEDQEMPSTSQQISCSAPILNQQPKLTGTPGSYIDLISGEVKSGVELLKKKFMYHSTIKTAEELEREKERKVLPGSALQKLKRDLEYKIMDNRTQEWTKRLEELTQKKKEEDDNLSDYEEILEKEEACKEDEQVNDEVGDESCEEEEELEENDVDLTKERSRKKCNLLDEEAEVDDEEDDISANESDSSDDSSDELVTNTGTKKPLTRILKPFNDSDSSDDENGQKLNESVKINETDKSQNLNTTFGSEKENCDLSTPIKENGLKSNTSDVFDSQSETKNNSFSYDWEDLPLGQKIVQTGMTPTPSSSKRLSDLCLSESKTFNTTGRSDLAYLVSPIINLTGVPRLSSEKNHSEELTSPSKYKTSIFDNDKMNNLQKKLLFDTEETQNTQDLHDLESLCSGKFPSQETTTSSKPSNLANLIDEEKSELTQDTESELMDLCTGKFVGLNDTQPQNVTTLPLNDSQGIVLSLSETQNTEELNKFMENILTRKEVEENSEPISNSENMNSETQSKPTSKLKNSTINSFFTNSKVRNTADFIGDKNHVNEEQEITVSSRGGKLAILSSDEEEALDENGEKLKSKVLKSKRERNKKKKYHLQFSDDESEDEVVEEKEDDLTDMEENENDDKVVDYDSEENEIEVQMEEIVVPKNKKKKTSEFFEQEAELTSEDEWIGSGDEDERDLDKLEWEEGDADQFDQRQVKKQLEKIHLRTILDDDKREIRMLQEILLEDDLEGGTRERKFRWRNVDSTIEMGATIGDDDVDCSVEDMQTEEEWRKQRHERETFLRQLMEKENTMELSQFSQDSESSLKIVSRKSTTSTFITKKSIENVNSNVQNGEPNSNNDDCLERSKKIVKDLPSPVKKPFSLFKTNIRGSFLSRGQAALNRLAILTKNAPQPHEEGEPTNLSSLAPGKKKNFVFATVSPPCNKNDLPEDIKVSKRKAASEVSTPLLIKKTKLVEQETYRTRKSLMDHID